MSSTVKGEYCRSKLPGHPSQSLTTVHGKTSLFLGLPFFLAGIPIILIATGYLPVKPSSVHAPLWVIGASGAFFSLAGLTFIRHGMQGIKRQRRLDREKKLRPQSPWLWDYEWHPLGISTQKVQEIVQHAAGALGIGVFLTPFNWLAFASDVGNGFVMGIVGFFDIFLLLALGKTAYKGIQLLKYGISRLRFTDFPFFLDGFLRVNLEGLPNDFNKLQLDLRCIEETYEVHGSGQNRTQVVVCYQRFHEPRSLQNFLDRPGGRLFLEFELPPEPELATRLAERPAWFWELEVSGDAPGVDYHARFLLPVYAQS
ncbi:MAG: hypothetical protein ACE5ER_02250 [Nitrospinaceae bacterium]